MISIIVPVYNVEAYLPRCIDSILAQTYEDFELLLVDDGSPDHCGAICEDYAKKDGRIRVFHKENGGQADARNYALDRMKGEYVTFIDSDDYIGRDYLSILIQMMNVQGVDISAIKMAIVEDLDTNFQQSDDKRTIMNKEEAFKEVLIGRIIACGPCAKLFKSVLFDNNRFPKGKVYEDLMLIPYIIEQCNKCSYSSSIQYYYYQRQGSTILSPTTLEKSGMWLEGMEKLLSFTKKHYPQFYIYPERYFVHAVFWHIIDWFLYDEEYLYISKKIRKNDGIHFLRAWILPKLTIKERLKSTLFFISIRLYRAVRILWIEKIDNPDTKRYRKAFNS